MTACQRREHYAAGEHALCGGEQVWQSHAHGELRHEHFTRGEHDHRGTAADNPALHVPDGTPCAPLAPYYEQDGVTLYCGDALDVLAQLPADSVDCVVTSPPYWALRVYSGAGARAWGGDPEHAHDWQAERITGEGYTGTARWQHSENGRGEGQPDDKRLREAVSRQTRPEAWSTDLGEQHWCGCGAWRGCYGLEPTHTMYVDHTVEVLRAIRCVLKPTGVVFWNIGDSYAVSGKGSGGEKQATNAGAGTGRPVNRHMAQGRTSQRRGRSNIEEQRMERGAPGLKPKDMCLIPQRVAIAAQDDGWTVRCDVVWAKPNPMPESVRDRPTKAHEYIWMLTKRARYWWDQEAVREQYSASTIQRISQDSFDAQKGGEKDYARGTNSNRSARRALENLKAKQDRVGRRQYDGFNDRWDESEPRVDGGRNIRSVWTFATQPSPLPHFAAFPDALAETCIKAACPPDGLVLDPFAGTGTALHVARSLGRRAIGIELSPEYCELAAQRLRYGVRGTLTLRAGQAPLWDGGEQP